MGMRICGEGRRLAIFSLANWQGCDQLWPRLPDWLLCTQQPNQQQTRQLSGAVARTAICRRFDRLA